MKSLAHRKTRLVFETEDSIFERGQSRQIIVEARPEYCYLRLKGSRRRFAVCYASVYRLAVDIAEGLARREKAAAKKKGSRK